MMTHRATRRWRTIGALPISLIATVALMATVVFVPGAGAAAEQKTYTADVSPHLVGAGQTIDFALAIVNTTKTQQIGSANLSAPSSFSLKSAVSPIPGGGTATIVGSTGGTVQLRNLAIPPGGARTVTIAAEVPCANGAYNWSMIAKQSNNFSGPPGNNFIPPPASGLVTNVSGQCSLSWLTQPSHAKTNTAITHTPYDAAVAPPVGPFIQVEVRSVPYGGGTSTTLVAFSSDVVTLLIGDDFSGPPATTLAGTTSVRAVNGVATFSPGPRISDPGPNYTLLATNPIMFSGQSTPGESAPFNVSDAVCVAPCTTAETAAGGTRARVTSDSSTGFVAASVGVGVDLTCPSSPSPNQQVVAVFPLNPSPGSTLLIETTFSLAILTTPWSQVRACLASKEPFTQADGTPAVGPVTIANEEDMFVGVPPDCDNQTPVPPCFLPSLRNNQTDEITVRLLVPGTDPFKR
jgi:hypothetical protein